MKELVFSKENLEGVVIETPNPIKLEDTREYWDCPYDKAVSREIHKVYPIDHELAILRQRDSKTAEFDAYFRYCEDRKVYVKQMQEKFGIVL